jgi:hypothetical protein
MKLVDISILAQYNAETSRGIQHREDWIQRMALLQQQFDAERKKAAINGTPLEVTE